MWCTSTPNGVFFHLRHTGEHSYKGQWLRQFPSSDWYQLPPFLAVQRSLTLEAPITFVTMNSILREVHLPGLFRSSKVIHSFDSWNLMSSYTTTVFNFRKNHSAFQYLAASGAQLLRAFRLCRYMAFWEYWPFLCPGLFEEYLASPKGFSQDSNGVIEVRVGDAPEPVFRFTMQLGLKFPQRTRWRSIDKGYI